MRTGEAEAEDDDGDDGGVGEDARAEGASGCGGRPFLHVLTTHDEQARDAARQGHFWSRHPTFAPRLPHGQQEAIAYQRRMEGTSGTGDRMVGEGGQGWCETPEDNEEEVAESLCLNSL